ncbi:MAG: PH domain-containing protein [Planctomycetota bacterium]|jgi:uncharacterized membrane protein YdbT with pleckstrin-like domain
MTSRTEQATEWIYQGIWSGLVDWFRVPKEPPTLPVAADQFRESFRPALGFLRYMRFWFWLIAILFDVMLVVGYMVATLLLIHVDLWWVALLLLPPFLVLLILPDIVAYIALHLRYDTTWYVMTDRSLRIRRGIWTIHEMTITFDNVQNVKVRQGPVQRAFGISSLVVETAGAGGAGGAQGAAVANRGVLDGISDPERLRDLILKRLRRSVGAGLGDPEDLATAVGAAWTPEHLNVLREIREAIRARPAT